MSRHEFDPVSLIAGLLFAAIGLTYLVGEGGGAHPSGRLVLAIGLAGLGVAGVAGALRRLNRPAGRAGINAPAAAQPDPGAASERPSDDGTAD